MCVIQAAAHSHAQSHSTPQTKPPTPKPQVLHVRKLYAALQEVDASGIFPPHHDSLHHFLYAFFEFQSYDVRALAAAPSLLLLLL